jgi:hypothetical protein
MVDFVYNATRALGIEHTPFEAYMGFTLDMLLNMRPFFPVSQDATER